MRRSKFLRAARSSQWKTDPTKPTDLTDHDPEVFPIYLQCVYTGKVVTPCPKADEWCAQARPLDRFNDEINEGIDEEIDDYFKILIILYSSCDKL